MYVLLIFISYDPLIEVIEESAEKEKDSVEIPITVKEKQFYFLWVSLERSTTTDSSCSRPIICLVAVFTLDTTHHLTNNKCLPKFGQTDNNRSGDGDDINLHT